MKPLKMFKQLNRTLFYRVYCLKLRDSGQTVKTSQSEGALKSSKGSWELLLKDLKFEENLPRCPNTLETFGIH